MIVFFLSIFRDMLATAEIYFTSNSSWFAVPLCGLRAGLSYMLISWVAINPATIPLLVAGEATGTALSVVGQKWYEKRRVGSEKA